MRRLGAPAAFREDAAVDAEVDGEEDEEDEDDDGEDADDDDLDGGQEGPANRNGYSLEGARNNTENGN